jgi:hypothetical protein
MMPARNYEYGQSVRRGRVFTLRLEPKDEEALKKLQAEHERQVDYSYNRYGSGRRGGLGSFIVWAALQFKPAHRSGEPNAKIRRSVRP